MRFSRTNCRFATAVFRNPALAISFAYLVFVEVIWVSALQMLFFLVFYPGGIFLKVLISFLVFAIIFAISTLYYVIKGEFRLRQNPHLAAELNSAGQVQLKNILTEKLKVF